MTDREMLDYITAQLATVRNDMFDAQKRIAADTELLAGLCFAERAYDDMLNEITRRQGEQGECDGLEHTSNVG